MEDFGWDGEEDETCARHLMSSVGVEITHVARPPKAPAMKVVRRVGCCNGDEVAGVGVREPYVRYEDVRL